MSATSCHLSVPMHNLYLLWCSDLIKTDAQKTTKSINQTWQTKKIESKFDDYRQAFNDHQWFENAGSGLTSIYEIIWKVAIIIHHKNR